MQSKETIWAEKYRPTELKDLISNKQLKDKMWEFINEKDIPHLLFYGSPGTGKSTVAKILCNKIAPDDYLYINASKENSVDDVRNRISEFASSVGFGGIKIIFLDESDYLSINAMGALRSVFEDFSEKTRFILTANYHEKIIPAIHSRCQTFGFKSLSTKQIVRYAAQILKSEGVIYNPKEVVEIIKKFQPDVRKIINILQQNTMEGVLALNRQDLIDNDFKVGIMNALSKPKAFIKIRQIVADNNINQFEEIYRYMFDNIDKIVENKDTLLEYYVKIAEYLYRDTLVADKEINFMGMIADLIN